MGMPKTFEVPVVGVTFQSSYPQSFLSLEENEKVLVVRDVNNENDPNAVRVESKNGVVLGFIPSAIAKRLAPELDSGKTFQVTARLLINAGHKDRPGVMLKFHREP